MDAFIHILYLLADE